MLTFGRYTDAYKSKLKIESWNNSEKLFGEKNYFDSYVQFFDYIKDDILQNVTYFTDNGKITFEILQGSKKVKGWIDSNKISAESKVAEFDKLSIALMRRLLEMNYSMYYSRFALCTDHITIRFDSSIIDASPRKLYYALKELAMRADKQDDLLRDDFSSLKPIDSHGIEIAPESKEMKYKYFLKWITENVTYVESMNENQMSGGISYLLLCTLYKIDYLISPQGTFMNEIEKMSYKYFEKNEKTLLDKNRDLKESLAKLKETPKDNVLEDLYMVRSTFGMMNPAPHQLVVDAVDNNIKNVKWYAEHSYVDIAESIFEYIAGYCLFSFGMPKPTIALFDIIMNVMNQDYYSEAGKVDVLYDLVEHKLNEELIRKRISDIIEEWKGEYTELKINLDDLKFDTRLNFLKSLTLAIQDLDYSNL